MVPFGGIGSEAIVIDNWAISCDSGISWIGRDVSDAAWRLGQTDGAGRGSVLGDPGNNL